MRKWKPVFIFVVIAVSFYSLIPSLRFYGMSEDEKARLSYDERDKYIQSIIKLGLDLQGGMHLVLEVDDSELDENAKKDALDRAIKIIRNRVDQFGVSEPVIQKQGEKRIIVEMPGLQNVSRAKGLIGQTALLEFKLVKESRDMTRILRELDKALKGIKIEGTVVDSSAASDTEAESAGKAKPPGEDTGLAAQTSSQQEPVTTEIDSTIPSIPGVEVEMPIEAISRENPFTSYLLNFYGGGAVADVKNMEKVDILLSTPQAKSVIPGNLEFLWNTEDKAIEGGGRGRVLYLLDKKPLLTGRTLVNAYTQPDPKNPANLNVAFNLNKEGAVKFARFTGENIGKQIAIVLDNKVRSAPTVITKIPNGEGRITGRFSDIEANDLSIVLRAGALPAPVEIKEERSVGPSAWTRLDSTWCSCGDLWIYIGDVIHDIVLPGLRGFLACSALLLNLIIVLATLARLHAALTLPGIAGLILTIGMAVDANVLIFERIREELAKAKTVRSAIDSGYARAFTTIFDANFTTLITAFVLWQFGTGPIKGFATTLSIGIIASMFTALMCTRRGF